MTKSWVVWNYPNQNEAKSSEFRYRHLQSGACPIEVVWPSHVTVAGPHLASVPWPVNAGASVQLLPWELSSGLKAEWSANVHLWLLSEMPQVFWPWNTKSAIVTLAQWWLQLTDVFSVCLCLGVNCCCFLPTPQPPELRRDECYEHWNNEVIFAVVLSKIRSGCNGMVGDTLLMAWPCAGKLSWLNPPAVHDFFIKDGICFHI